MERLVVFAVVSAIGLAVSAATPWTGKKVAFLGDSITQFGSVKAGYVKLVMKGLRHEGVKAVMLPAGVSRNRVERKRTTLKNTPGRMPCVLSEFTYEGNYVGYAIQYEKDIGASLLRPKAHATYDIFKYQP